MHPNVGHGLPFGSEPDHVHRGEYRGVRHDRHFSAASSFRNLNFLLGAILPTMMAAPITSAGRFGASARHLPMGSHLGKLLLRRPQEGATISFRMGGSSIIPVSRSWRRRQPLMPSSSMIAI